MKRSMVAALAAVGALALGGCVAIPVPYYSDGYYYGAAPAVSVGVGIHGGHGHHGYWHGHRHHGHRYHHRPHRW